jgi:FLVCR family MFS transporter 7
MAPQSETSGDARTTEKHQNIQDAPNNEKTESTTDDKAGTDSVPGGFSFLRTMKMRTLKNRGSAASAPPNDSNVSNGNASGSGIDSKHNDELKVTQSNGSGDGLQGIGEIEPLHEVRSDDELLGDEERGSAPQEPRTQEDGNNGTEAVDGTGERVYKVYKRRWFGLVQLVLLNIIVSWDVSSPLKSSQSQSTTNAEHSGSPSRPTPQRQLNTIM